MNPAIAKMTPWLMEAMSESLAETGLSVTEVEVNALTSWTQFYKNIPIALIVYLLIFSSILTQEYQKGTLIPIVTKGMKRWKILVSKEIILLSFWTVGYWLTFTITYCYNAYFWDNEIASNICFSASCFYLLGLWLITLILLLSVLFDSTPYIVLALGGIFLITYLLGLFPKIEPYLPAQLLNCSSLLFDEGECSDYLYAIIITLALSVVNTIAAITCFNKRNI